MGKFAVLIEIENPSIQEADEELIRLVIENAIKANMPPQDIKAVKIITIR